MGKKKSVFFYKILIILMIFDGIRSNTVFSEYITLFRDCLLLVIFFKTISKGNFKIKSAILTFGVLFFLYHTFVGFFSLVDVDSLTLYYKTYQLLLGVYVFAYMPVMTNLNYNYFIRFSVIVSVIFVIINTLLFFIHIPIWKSENFWWGRFSVGYPTMDTITLSYVLVILIFYDTLQIKNWQRVLFTLIITVGIMFQVTGTGILLLSIIYFLAFIYFLFTKNNKINNIIRLNIITVFGLLLAALIIIPPIIRGVNPTTYENATTIFFTKLSFFTNKNYKESRSDINTIEWRSNAIEKARKNIDTESNALFGIGLSKFSFNPNTKKKGAIMLENQFYYIVFAYGYIGLSFFVLFILSLFLKVLRDKGLKNNMKLIFLLSILIFVINGYTLLSLILFSNALFFAMILGFYYNFNKTLIGK